MVNYSNVSARALLVSVSISMWEGRKYDKGATKQVHDANHASANAGRYNKKLLAGAREHEDLIKRTAIARDVHYTQTLPWSDEGWRLLPSRNYFEYAEAMRKEFSKLDAMLIAFLDAYPELVKRDESEYTALGKLWNPRDYPPVKALRGKFSWSIDFKPVPDAGDIRVDLPADQISAIQAQITERMEQSTREAMTDAWARLHEAVQRIHKASGEDGVVRSNLIEHAQSVIDVLGRLNVAESEELNQMRQRVQRELTTITLDDLRKDKKLRADTQQRAEAIMKAMGDYFTPVATTSEEAA